MDRIVLVPRSARSLNRCRALVLSYSARLLLTGLGLASLAAEVQAQFATPSAFGAQSNGNFTGMIPIRLPPATRGLAPSLALGAGVGFIFFGPAGAIAGGILGGLGGDYGGQEMGAASYDAARAGIPSDASSIPIGP